MFDEPLRFDVLIENCLLLELKCVQEIMPIHKAQLLSYMKLLDIPTGLFAWTISHAETQWNPRHAGTERPPPALT